MTLSFPHTWFYRKVLSRTPSDRKTTQYASLTCFIGIFSFWANIATIVFFRQSTRFFWKVLSWLALVGSHVSSISRKTFSLTFFMRENRSLIRFANLFHWNPAPFEIQDLTSFSIGIQFPSFTMVYGEYSEFPTYLFSRKTFSRAPFFQCKSIRYASLTLVHWTCPSF